jgi:hypothetical protein
MNTPAGGRAPSAKRRRPLRPQARVTRGIHPSAGERGRPPDSAEAGLGQAVIERVLLGHRMADVRYDCR